MSKSGAVLPAALSPRPVLATEAKDAPLPDFVPAFSWTGIYLGVQGGHAWGEVNFDDGGVTVSGPQHEGWFGGGYAGVTLQLNPFVLGVEGDVNGANLDGAPHVIGGSSVRTDVDALTSIRGRVGLAADRLLLFATSGWAWADVSGTLIAPDLSRFKVDTTVDGWILGGGLDYAFTDKFIGRIEYRHYALGETDLDTGSAGVAVKF
jgi:outer membrane immunogenic protein